VRRYKRFENTEIMGYTLPMVEMVLHPDSYVNILTEKIINFYNKNEFNNLKDLIDSLNSYFIIEKIEFIKGKKLLKFDSGIDSGGYNPKNNKIIFFYTEDIINAFKFKNIKNDYEDFKWFLEDFKDYLGHETIHRMQSIEDKVKYIKAMSGENEKLHYSQPKEIMAYAWLIVQTFKMNGKDEDYIKFILSGKRDLNNVKVINYIPAFKKYYNLFDKDSKVMKLLYKYIYLYMDK